MSKFKTHKRYSKKNLTNKYALKDPKYLEDVGTAKLLAFYRNLVYNLSDDYEELTPVRISILFWGYMYRFFTRTVLLNTLRIGINSHKGDFYSLIENGYIEEYSPRQKYTAFESKPSSAGDWTYQAEVEKTLSPRYTLSLKGIRFVENSIKNFDNIALAKTIEDETRGIELKY